MTPNQIKHQILQSFQTMEGEREKKINFSHMKLSIMVKFKVYRKLEAQWKHVVLKLHDLLFHEKLSTTHCAFDLDTLWFEL